MILLITANTCLKSCFRILVEANTSQKLAPVTISSLNAKKPVAHFSNIANPKPMSPYRSIPVLPDPSSAIVKKTSQVCVNTVYLVKLIVRLS